jgi:hypothetical protein
LFPVIFTTDPDLNLIECDTTIGGEEEEESSCGLYCVKLLVLRHFEKEEDEDETLGFSGLEDEVFFGKVDLEEKSLGRGGVGHLGVLDRNEGFTLTLALVFLLLSIVCFLTSNDAFFVGIDGDREVEESDLDFDLLERLDLLEQLDLLERFDFLDRLNFLDGEEELVDDFLCRFFLS